MNDIKIYEIVNYYLLKVLYERCFGLLQKEVKIPLIRSGKTIDFAMEEKANYYDLEKIQRKFDYIVSDEAQKIAQKVVAELVK